MPKNRLIVSVIFILLVYLIISSVRSILELKKAGETVVDYEKELVSEEKKNQELKERLKEVQKPEFIEREAREKLGLGKPGESIVIIPKITVMPPKKEEKNLANWERWWKLFF